jgi:hypothetical protein
MNFEYLIEASNKMTDALVYLEHNEGGNYIDPKSLDRYLDFGCQALRRLTNDQEFISLLKKDKTSVVRSIGLAGVATGSLDAFLSAFLKVDKGLLLEAGMNRKMADYLFRDAQQIRVLLRDTSKIPTAEMVLTVLNDMKYTVCNEAERVTERSMQQRRLRQVVFSVGGGSIIGVNHLASAFFAPLTELSKAYGKHLIGKARNDG